MTTREIHDAGAPTRWTARSIRLHWLIVVLLAVQFAEGEWMAELFDSSAAEPPTAAASAFGYVHIAVGVLIFLAAAVRLWDRLARGRPPYPADEPRWARIAARVVHAALWTLVLAMPALGAAAWFSGAETLGELHGWGWSVLMVLAGVHVVGALASHFWFRTAALTRIMPGQGRSA